MRRLIALVVCVLLAGCASAPPRHELQTAPGVSLAGYRTFAWSVPAGSATAEAPLRILDTHIRTAVRDELTRRGYVEVTEAPDVLVDYETASEDRLRSSPVRVGIGMGSFGGHVGGSASMGTPSVQSYQEGRLVIHLLDAAKKQEVWYGTVSGQADRKNLDAAAVARVVALAMESFPARAAIVPQERLQPRSGS
jgi:hypothetical protein